MLLIATIQTKAKPFQFSLRRALGATAWLCVTASLVSRAWSFLSGDLNNVTNGIIAVFALIGAIASLGAAIGSVTGHVVDSVIGLMVLITVILFVFVFATGILPWPWFSSGAFDGRRVGICIPCHRLPLVNRR
jgi:hypothetical protein